jgi:outer membrane protein
MNRNKQILTIQQNMVDIKKELFEKNISIEYENAKARLAKYEMNIKSYKEIIQLKERILNTYSLQLEQGVISATTYVTELNSLLQTKISLSNYKLLYQQTITELAYIKN